MSKKILILNGSPRKNGNTSCLIDYFIKGTESVGNSVTRFDLQKMNIKPCIGCGNGGADENKENPCTQKDDMAKIYCTYYEADTIVFATPLYSWGMSAQLKTAVDRFAAILEANVQARNGENIFDTKEAVLLVAAGDDFEENFMPLVHHYKAIVKYLTWIDKGMVLAGGVSGIGDIAGKPFLDEAQKLGASI